MSEGGVEMIDIAAAVRLARIDAYKEILGIAEAGCERLEYIDYLRALIRLEVKRLPGGVV